MTSDNEKKSITLTDFADGRFTKMPTKRKRLPNRQTVTVLDWSLNSRYLMAHLFFNVLGESIPKGLPKGKLPSMDADALEKMRNPIAHSLIEFRSAEKTLKSLEGVQKFIFSSPVFRHPGDLSRALLRFNIIGYDNVERIFSVSENSIPINVDKRVRKAFIPPLRSVLTQDILSNPDNVALFNSIS